MPMTVLRNRISEVLPWCAFFIACIVGYFVVDSLNHRVDVQGEKIEVMSGALVEIKQATQHEDWTPSQKTHSIEQVLATTERECKVKVD